MAKRKSTNRKKNKRARSKVRRLAKAGRNTGAQARLYPVKIHNVATSLAELSLMAAAKRERINWAEAVLGIPRLWRQTQGRGIRVAVLDTGIDPDHPDLQSAIAEMRDFTGDGIEDENGHGTHCAGIIAARLNNVGFVGVAPQASLLVGKVLSNSGSGSFDWTARGVDWAVSQRANIISMSLGGPSISHSLYKAISSALARGVHVICAAGNSGSLYQNSIGYPGKFGGVITVASHDRNGNPSGFTSHGGEIDVMAPGSEIWSTYKKGGYATLSGTSMATPFVAGLSALVVAKHRRGSSHRSPLRNVEELKEHLLRMATHPGWHDNQSGYGLLQPFMGF